MKGMPLPFDFQGKGVFFENSTFFAKNFGGEPTSVLDSARIPSGPTSSSTLSSSHGGGDTAVPSPKWHRDSNTATSSSVNPPPPSLEIGTAMEDWESVLSESAAAVVSPSQEQSILRWIMGDVEDTNMGSSLNKVLQIGGAAPSTAAEFDFSGGFGAVDQGFGGGGDQLIGNLASNFKFPQNSMPNNIGPIFDSQLLMNHHQTHHHSQNNPSFFFNPTHHEQNLFGPPHPKRHNPCEPGFPMNLPAAFPNNFHLLPQNYPNQQRPIGPGQKPENNQQQQQQQAIVDQLYKSAELVQTGNLVLAQSILARLNHQLSPIGKPFHRASFYCKEALQTLIQENPNPNTNPFSLIFKIGAYKSFSEISPIIQFANFTCNQALLETLENYDSIHIIDFDIGYGGQWASLMQELALRNNGPPSLKITALASTSTHDQIELTLTRENLIQFANDVNISFEFEAITIDALNFPFSVSENEAIAVNLPVGCLASYRLSVPFVLAFIKQLSPKIVVSLDRGCDRTDLPFANHIVHVLQSYSNLLESLDAVNVNSDALQKIERFLIQPGFEKIVTGRSGSFEKTQHWRTMFLSSGFSPVGFSNFTESQAECVVKRTPVRGFQVEKRQSSLVLCWQRKELISASAWRC